MSELETLAMMPHDARRQAILTRSPEAVRTDWNLWASAGQRPPPGAWRIWALIAGRGYGKTRAGAEWVRGLAEANEDVRIALVGATMADARDVMIEGESGLLAVSPAATRPRWEPARGRLSWRSGAQAFVFSGEAPERLRGPSHHYAWCDEFAKWAYPQDAWDNLQLTMRLGSAPRTMVTTTPRTIPALRNLIAAPGVIVTNGRSAENCFLPEAFADHIRATYGGTRFGRQELDGQMIEDIADALWTRPLIEASRTRIRPELVRVVVGVDPPAGRNGDACGIVVCGLDREGIGYVIEDASVAGRAPEDWARAVVQAAARHRADLVVAEANNGGDMVGAVLTAADAGLPLALVHATRGKAARAEPVATLYTRNRVRHLHAFPELEDELCGLVSGGTYEGPGRSPDRADACVWALTNLMLGPARALPRVRVV